MTIVSSRIFWVGLIILVPVFTFLNQDIDVGVYDESIILTGAIQIQNGRFPGTDFFTVYGPLQFLTAAGLLELFDQSILALRLYFAAIVSVTLLAITAAIRPTRTMDSAGLALFFLGIAYVYILRFGSPLYPTQTLPVFAALFVLVQAQGRSWTFGKSVLGLAAFLTAVLALTPVRGLTMMVMLIIAIPFQLWNKDMLSSKAFGHEVAKIGLATVIAGAILGAYDVITGGSLQATVIFSVTEHIPVYALNRALPFPTLSQNTSMIFTAYFPILTFLVGSGLYFYASANKRKYSSTFRTTLFWLLFFTLAFYQSGLVRTGGAQMWGTYVFALASATYLVMHVRLQKPRTNRLAIALGLFSLLYVAEDISNGITRDKSILAACDLAKINDRPMGCFIVGDADEWEQRKRHIFYLEGYLYPTEPIFIANPRHDFVFGGDMSYYFVLNRVPSTHWAHMEPGIQTTQAVQEDIISDLKSQIDRHGRAVVLIHPAGISKEPNLSSVSSNITVLDEYLAGCRVVKAWPTLTVKECVE